MNVRKLLSISIKSIHTIIIVILGMEHVETNFWQTGFQVSQKIIIESRLLKTRSFEPHQ